MKLGLLGHDPLLADVIAAAERRGDRIVLACDQPPGGPEGGASGGWDALLDPEACDAVLVAAAGFTDARGEAVRALVQAGRPLLVVHPATLSMLWAYELDMIRADSGGRIVPLLVDRLHPFVARLRGRIEAALAIAGPLGAIESLSLERRLVDRSRGRVLAAFARDVDIARVLVGDPGRLSTLVTGDVGDAAAWATLSVGLGGSDRVPVKWQVARGEPEGLVITLHHARGTEVVEAPDVGGPWTWAGEPGPAPTFDRGEAAVALLHGARPPGDVPVATWQDAARAIELAETVPRSLTKGRAVDLHQEEFTELGTFRGTMASLGCGLVLAALVIVLVATLLGGVAHEAGWELGERIAAAWPGLVLAVLALFLALQVLPLLVGDTRPSGGGDSRGEDGAGRE